MYNVVTLLQKYFTVLNINIIKLLFLPSKLKILIVMNKMSEFCKYVLSMILIKLSVKHVIFCSNETCLK